MPACDEDGVVRNSPAPGVYPSSVNLSPEGVSAGKSVWQLPQGCPVWRAKLGSACADGAKPTVRKPARTTTIATAANSPQFSKGRIKRQPSPRIALPRCSRHSVQRANTESKAAYDNNDSSRVGIAAKLIATVHPISR